MDEPIFNFFCEMVKREMCCPEVERGSDVSGKVNKKTPAVFMMPARNSVAAGGGGGGGVSSNKVKYSRLSNDDDGYIDLQFKKNPPKVPYKAIGLAAFLFLIGSVLIVIGAFLLSGSIEVAHPDRTVPVLIIGILVFLPGFYHLRIAYYASKGSLPDSVNHREKMQEAV
ncbi:hypothetical protein DPEC_G00336840 [Dallia pectoralis]|uniref:Uncharacterized protein n=1 Tax=Dallia pectoralis TaxID=75939 RepID=A0ACC2F7N1_DALPE|nr:hypothetical protein DPEC_G00336840 [Dallia pectoralis]